MKKTPENYTGYTYTLTSSHLTSISAEEIYEKFGQMIFWNDKEYDLWYRENIGGNNSIHKLNDND